MWVCRLRVIDDDREDSMARSKSAETNLRGNRLALGERRPAKASAPTSCWCAGGQLYSSEPAPADADLLKLILVEPSHRRDVHSRVLSCPQLVIHGVHASSIVEEVDLLE